MDTNKNLWYDFGTGEGGNAIKLLCKLKNISPMDAFKSINGSTYNEFKGNCIQKQGSSLEIQDVSRPVKHPALIQYLTSRSINLKFSLCCEKLNEVKYRVNNKDYFALGFLNDLGGFEIRSALWKGASSPKSISTIKGETKTLNVFEGFMDYLSALSYYKISKSKHTSIILNGTGQTQQLLSRISNYEKVYLFVDNDNAGNKVVELITQNHSNVINVSPQLYPNCKDFNEFLS